MAKKKERPALHAHRSDETKALVRLLRRMIVDLETGAGPVTGFRTDSQASFDDESGVIQECVSIYFTIDGTLI